MQHRSFMMPRLLAALATIGCLGAVQAQFNYSNSILLSGPAWEIALTDYGYSDYLGDLTPGFAGREYLSGEWGAAIGYRQGNVTRSPTWLEPVFVYPDWTTNSDFKVISPITAGDANSFGLPTASSVIANDQLRITQQFQIVDTRTGIAMGNAAASQAGASRLSNRYVLQQTYTFENISGARIDNLQYFQFLHGLTAQAGVYDQRNYGGAMGAYQYDVTLGGDASGGSMPGGQFDYIGFHSKIAPTAVEVGGYGVEGVDDHGIGKPLSGTHLSVEGNSLNGADAYAPAVRWVAGAQRFDLVALDDGQSTTIDVALSILTGYQVPTGGDGSGIIPIGGGSSNPGGVDAEFLGEHSAGQFYWSFELEDPDGLGADLLPLSFGVPGSRLPLWEIEYEGSFSGGLQLTFAFDPDLLAGIDAERLHIYHLKDGSWQDLGGFLDLAAGTIRITTDSLSPFALGLAPVPEPGSWALMLGGLALLGRHLRQGRRR